MFCLSLFQFSIFPSCSTFITNAMIGEKLYCLVSSFCSFSMLNFLMGGIPYTNTLSELVLGPQQLLTSNTVDEWRLSMSTYLSIDHMIDLVWCYTIWFSIIKFFVLPGVAKIVLLTTTFLGVAKNILSLLIDLSELKRLSKYVHLQIFEEYSKIEFKNFFGRHIKVCSKG